MADVEVSRKEASDKMAVVAEATGADGATADGELSKKKRKKLEKAQKKLAFKLEKRLKERERKKERRKQQREGEIPPDLAPHRKQLKRNTMETSSCRQRIAIDCSYDSLMMEKDIKDLGGQLARSYSINRRATNPVQYYIVTANGEDSAATKARIKVLTCASAWDVHTVTGEDTQATTAPASAAKATSTGPSSAILSAFKKEEIVYLTSDSPNVLETLDESKVYVIGGLVDHNAHKGLTLRLANEMGVAHAQLPIGQYVRMLYRKVLTVCHVFEILVKYSECKDWQRAFMDTIPKRHSVEPIASTSSDATAAVGGSSEKTAASGTS